MITITTAVKDILLQIATASSFLLLFQWKLNQGHMERRRSLWSLDDHAFLVMACALSLVLCSMLSGSLYGMIYVNWGILPAFIGMLYGSIRARALLAVMLPVCTYVFSYPVAPEQVLLDSGILMYPLLFSIAPRFKLGTAIEKMIMLWIVLAPCMLFIALTPLFDGKDFSSLQDSQMVLILSVLFVNPLLGCVWVRMLESAWDKRGNEERLARMSENFKREIGILQQITDMVPLSVISIDDNGRITNINDASLKKLETEIPHITRSEVLDCTLSDLAHRLKLNDNPELKQLLDRIVLKQGFTGKVACLGKVLYVLAAPLVPKEQEGRQGGMVLIVQDMTEEENIRSELNHVERLTLVGRMAAGITHEIRNPMAVVRGFLQLMREKSPSDMESYYRIVMEELDRANSIINDFLSLAQSGLSGKEDSNLHDVIEELAPLLWADANLRGQSVELRLCDSLPMLWLNTKEIKQLVLNLGRNAMEAMESKGVLTLETRCVCEMVELLVKDTGSGMSDIELEKLFVPFFTTKEQGTGLGLPLCLSIAERHGGSISVDSRPGAGTVFTVSFPYESREKVSTVC
ncbi:signal transduction histidine kinase [Paenibacillus forsythiae]|uniref:histidine kinase n=1 Tax=Paenibacillus forsythiae TaxID=365616 RepID=A0ABU3HCD2_9BACL|nr:ATP-binding protein [Paenibacillus forsythiae]MDT3428472.1 signal transduction histidine kinase [Paenibacillus forsythiae]